MTAAHDVRSTAPAAAGAVDDTLSTHGHPAGALLPLAVGALGVVYGDIGTSPLYALRECLLSPHAVALTPDNVLGVLSLIFWSLTMVVSVKYLVFVMRADNEGEGGFWPFWP